MSDITNKPKADTFPPADHVFMDPEALLKLLAERHWIEREDAERLLLEFEEQQEDLFVFLEASGVGSKLEILGTVAEALGSEFIDLRKAEFPPKLFDCIPPDLVRIYRCVPVHDSEEVLKLCLSDPLDDAAVWELATLLSRRISVLVADPSAVDELVERKLGGTLNSSPLVEAVKTAPVAASLGTSELPGQVDQTIQPATYSWLYAWGLLAFTAAATSAVYLHQRGTLKAASELIGEFDAVQEQRHVENLALDRRAYELEQQLERFDGELDRASADAVRLAQLEAELRRLEGRFQTLLEILPEAAKSQESDEPSQTPEN